MKQRSILCAAVLAAVGSAGAVTLVEDGRPRAVIITPEAPSPAAKLAARILRDHVRQVSGTALPIQKESDVSGVATKERAWVLVGEGRRVGEMGLSSAKVGPGGMVLHAKGDVLALFGADTRTPTDPDGTRYAVTTFLEDKLGVRWLWPGELGKVVPRAATIRVGDFHREFTPKLSQRRIRDARLNDRLEAGLGNLGFTADDYKRRRGEAEKTVSESGDWLGWHRLGGTMNLNSGHAFGHLWESYHKEHPDWFALQFDGTRDQSRNPERVRLCKSNPGLIAAIAREKTAELSRKPGLLGASLSPNDGSANSFCTCPKCEALDAPESPKVTLWGIGKDGRRAGLPHPSLTDRMVWFWNAIAEQVAKAHPDRLLTADAYSVYSTPPVKRELHPNLIVRFVPANYLDEARRQDALQDWDAWARAAKRIFYRPNLLLQGRRQGAPVVYVHKFAEDFRRFAHNRMMGTDFDSCAHYWAAHGLNYYVVARLNWDPDADVNAIVDDYCRAGFGPAAKTMRGYFDRLEAITNEIALGQATRREKLTAEQLAEERKLEVRFGADGHPYTAVVLDELGGLLAKASAEAAGDDAAQRRIEFLGVAVRWMRVESRAHAMLAARDTAGKAAAKKLLDERRVLMREIFEQHHLALNVAMLSWCEDGAWKALGWKPPRP